MRAVLAALALTACTSDSGIKIENPARDMYDTWEKVEPPGAVCSDGSQYKFFVSYSNKSDNLVVMFEPGGACWDYPSCSGAQGVRGAANPNGIPDDHWQLAPFISPFVNPNYMDSPTTTWNYVYVPYCTGDVHTGNVDATYTDESTGKTLTFRHQGHADVESVVSWIDENFTHVPKLLVTGCSAGGVGAIVNYHYLRTGIHSVKKSYLINDSGPIFPDPSYSTMLHQKIRSAWNLDPLGAGLPDGFSFTDMGTMNTALADEFPNDRLATTFFQRDSIYSDYTYARFYGTPTHDQEMVWWASDTQKLVDLYDTRSNLYYYLPWYRALDDSHCSTIVDWTSSDFEDGSVHLANWINDFMDDKPVASAMEAPVPGVDP